MAPIEEAVNTSVFWVTELITAAWDIAAAAEWDTIYMLMARDAWVRRIWSTKMQIIIASLHLMCFKRGHITQKIYILGCSNLRKYVSCSCAAVSAVLQSAGSQRDPLQPVHTGRHHSPHHRNSILFRWSGLQCCGQFSFLLWYSEEHHLQTENWWNRWEFVHISVKLL